MVVDERPGTLWNCELGEERNREKNRGVHLSSIRSAEESSSPVIGSLPCSAM